MQKRKKTNRGISKSILHFILHFILHSTILFSTLYSTQQFGQDVDVIDNFDINWSSKWLWPIIFSVRVIIQYMYVTCNIWRSGYLHTILIGLLYWRLDLSLPISGFPGLALLHLSNPVFHICVFWSWSAGFLPKQVLYFPCPIIHIFTLYSDTWTR